MLAIVSGTFFTSRLVQTPNSHARNKAFLMTFLHLTRFMNDTGDPRETRAEHPCSNLEAVALPRDDRVESRHQENDDQEAGDQPAHDDDRERSLRIGADAGCHRGGQ